MFEDREKTLLRLNALLAAVGALPPALLLVVIALAISGVGHGWSAPAQASFLAIPLLPLLGISWTYRYQRLGRPLAVAVVLAAIGLDALVVVATRGEVGHFQRALQDSSPLVLTWAALWLLWQAAAVAHLLSFRGFRLTNG